MLRYGAAEARLRAGIGQRQFEVQRGRARLHEASHGDRELGLDAAHHRIAGNHEGSLKGPGGDLRVETFDPLLAAGGGVAVNEGAVADPDAVEAHQSGIVVAGVAARRSGRRRVVELYDVPVPAPILEDLGQDRGPDQDDAFDLHLTLQEGDEGDPHLERLELDHGPGRATLEVRQAHLAHGQRGRREQGQADVAFDGQRAAGQLLDLGRDTPFLRVPVDEARADQDGRDQNDHQREQSNSQLLHGGYLLSTPVMFFAGESDDWPLRAAAFPLS